MSKASDRSHTEANHHASNRLTRRQVISRAAQLSAGAVVSGLVWRAGNQTEALAQTVGTIGAPSRGGVIRFAGGQGTPTDLLDPGRTRNNFEAVFGVSIFDTLVERNERWEITPALAESWKSNADGTEWVFRLRSGLRFNDGTPVRARDAAYSIARLLDTALGSFAYARLELSLTKEGIRAADDRTLVIRTKQPDVFLPLALAVPWTAIVKEGTTEFSVRTAIGTGPFQVTSFTPGQSWEVKRNPHYWRRGLPYLDGIQAVNIPEQITKIQSVISGDTDMTDYIDFSAVPMVQASDNARVLEMKNATDIRIIMNGSVAPFNDSRVTMAIKLASDRDLLLRTVYRGFGTVTTDVPVPPDDPFYPPGLRIRRDVDGAKRLLEEAGYPGGLDLELYAAEIFGGMVDSAVVFAQAVRDAGIRVNVKKVPTQTFLSQYWLKAPMYISYLNRRHPSTVFPLSFTSTAKWPEGQLHSQKFEALTADAVRTTDGAKRTRLYREGMRIIANEAPIHIPLFVSRLHAEKKRLRGVKLHPEKFLRFDEAFIQKA